MNRRTFFSKMLSVFAGTVVAPLVVADGLKGASQKTPAPAAIGITGPIVNFHVDHESIKKYFDEHADLIADIVFKKQHERGGNWSSEDISSGRRDRIWKEVDEGRLFDLPIQSGS